MNTRVLKLHKDTVWLEKQSSSFNRSRGPKSRSVAL